MKRFEDLVDTVADIEQIQKTIEKIFSSNVKLKSDIGKGIEVSEIDYGIINSDLYFVKNYVNEYGYDVNLYYDKVMYDRKYFIKFTICK